VKKRDVTFRTHPLAKSQSTHKSNEKKNKMGNKLARVNHVPSSITGWNAEEPDLDDKYQKRSCTLSNGDFLFCYSATRVIQYRRAPGASAYVSIQEWAWNAKTDFVNVTNEWITISRNAGTSVDVYVKNYVTGEETKDKQHFFWASFQRSTRVRAWMVKGYLLLSPIPSYDHGCYLRVVPITDETKSQLDRTDLHHALFGHWVTKIVVDETGEYFALYDYEDDNVNVYRVSTMASIRTYRFARAPEYLRRTEKGLTLGLWSNSTTPEIYERKIDFAEKDKSDTPLLAASGGEEEEKVEHMT